jgi:hypothetical protein
VTRGSLLDTNILSVFGCPRPQPPVVSFVATQPLERIFVGRVVFAEIPFRNERAEHSALNVPNNERAEQWLLACRAA